VTGDWLATVVAAAPGSYDVAYQIAGARVTGSGAGKVGADEIADLERRLGRLFFVTYTDAGAAARAHFPRDVEPGTRNLLQVIATETMLVRPLARPEEERPTHWIATERDGAGTYLAAYRETTPTHLTKTKLKYVQADGVTELSETSGQLLQIGASEQAFELDADGELEAFAGHEVTRLDLGSGGPGLTLRIAVRLAAGRGGAAPELVGALERSGGSLVTTSIVTHRPPASEVLAEHDRRLIEGATLAGLLDAAAGPAPPGISAAGPAAAPSPDPGPGERLEAWLRVHDGDASAAARRVRERAGAKTINDALAGAGTAAAQRALVALARDPSLPRAARVDAFTGLILLRKPLPDVMRAPRDLWGDPDAAIARAALFASGAMARSGRPEHPEDAGWLDRQLVAHLAQARDDGRRADTLAALGNSASPDTLAAVEGALAAGDPAVRAAAARALRLHTSPEVDRRLADAMVGDRDPGVRAASILAAGFRAVGPFVEPLTRAALADPVEYVRTNALDLLARHVDASPTIIATLTEVAEHDPAAGVRRLARDTLARHRR
jgi:hypothetical protein